MRRRETGDRAGRRAKPGTWAAGVALLTALVIIAMTPAAHGAAKLAVRLAAAMNSIPRKASAPAPAGMPTGVPFHGTPAVGALFSTTSSGGLGNHFCTASVVRSPHRDLAITAAHCVTHHNRAIQFVPGYSGGDEPYGVWTISKVIVDRAWSASGSIDDDVAFLLVEPARDGGSIQDVTGAEGIAFERPTSLPVQVIGYPDGHDLPLICHNRTSMPLPHQLEFDCGQYTDGTSGGPFLITARPGDADGTVIGVIGGYQQGGDLPQISYSPAFGPNVAALYRTAVSQG
ncbi:MAG TPA: trypsin-like serine protease [Streptosporangiaceae bacterium]|jgi:V8-like Glu-specific endopeptidase